MLGEKSSSPWFTRQPVGFLRIGHLVYLITQHPRTLQRDHPRRSQHDGLIAMKVPGPAVFFVVHLGFPEAADNDILANLQRMLHDLEECSDDVGGFPFGGNVFAEKPSAT
jgi:hypothetical protein